MNPQTNNASTGVFLNGRAQIIEMLRYMAPSDKENLLKNLRARNPSLANELIEQSLSFEDVGRLSDREIELIIQYTKAPILGMALKGVSQELQRRILLLAQRDYAEEAYQILTTPYANERQDIARAQNKIIGTLVSLSKRKQLRL